MGGRDDVSNACGHEADDALNSIVMMLTNLATPIDPTEAYVGMHRCILCFVSCFVLYIYWMYWLMMNVVWLSVTCMYVGNCCCRSMQRTGSVRIFEGCCEEAAQQRFVVCEVGSKVSL